MVYNGYTRGEGEGRGRGKCFMAQDPSPYTARHETRVVRLTELSNPAVLQKSTLYDYPMFLTDTVTLVFEVSDLVNTSPAMVARCGLVHCPENLVGWKSIFRTWLKGAHAKWDISNRG